MKHLFLKRVMATLALIVALVFAFQSEAREVRNINTGGAITYVNQRVTLSGNAVIVAGITDEDFGISAGVYASGVPAAVYNVADGEQGTYIASGAIAAGADVYPDSTGYVTATVQGKRIGKALNTTVNSGDLVTVIKLAPGNDRVIKDVTILAADANRFVFIADRAYTLVKVRENHSVAGGTSAALAIRKVTADAVAPSASAGANCIELLTATIDLTVTANTSQSPTLVSTAGVTNINAGDKIAFNFSGTLTGLVGVVTLELKPR